ncbi:hypothetical protein [Daejeonella lutea]|uniref:Uncharacterized protein n=1 Tax=Daejeonella lutea TaxID=572036 RepID=A0A1T5AJ78_9SPHI|nr:hypothetical protein [Daejeonella lutea]SKB34925.1 hypothetical protein SAMN05661099_0778 [Daejeonella lutea]
MDFPEDIKDKKGNPIHADDLVCYKQHYYRVFWNVRRNVLQMVSRNFAYLDLTVDILTNLENVGPYEGNERLFLSDGQVSF